MAIYVHKGFDSKLKKSGITNDEIIQAAKEVLNEYFEANLGGGVIKKRLPLQHGKSGGARVIIFFRKGNNLFFYDGWHKAGISKKGAREIEDDVLAAYKDLAKVFLSYPPIMIEKLKTAGILREVASDEKQTR